MNSNDLARANQLVVDAHSIEMALQALQGGGSIQSLTVQSAVREISASDAHRMANPQMGAAPSTEAMNYPMGGTFHTVNNLELPQTLLDGLAGYLQQRLQQISNELRQMGIAYGEKT